MFLLASTMMMKRGNEKLKILLVTLILGAISNLIRGRCVREY
jgi:hypothetical protein